MTTTAQMTNTISRMTDDDLLREVGRYADVPSDVVTYAELLRDEVGRRCFADLDDTGC